MRPAARMLPAGLVLLALGVLAIGVATAHDGGVPDSAWAVACGVAIGVLAWSDARPSSRVARTALVCAALLSAVAYTNFGALHKRGPIHHWEQFHYALGAKYFAELGYDGLYVASIGAQADLSETGRMQTWTRDLRSYEVVHTRSLIPHMQAVHARFTPERWEAFSHDNRFFAEHNGFEYLGKIRRDHGFNASPAWTFVAQRFVGALPIEAGTLAWLALLDLVLVVAAYVAVFRTFGLQLGAASLLLFGTSYVGQFDWIGGCFLRFDWLAALLFAVCALERRRFALSGALLGYATLVRLFPAGLLAGPAVLALRAWRAGRRPDWALRVAAGFGAALLVGVLAGAATGRGFSAWSEFATAIALHADTFLTNNVGLDNLIVYDRAIVERADVDWSLPEPWLAVQERIAARREAHGVWIWALRGGFLALLGLTAWRGSRREAWVAGMVAVFALATLSNYYWILLVLLPFAGRPRLVYGALGLHALLWALAPYIASFEARFGLFSWGLALLFLAWLAPGAVRALRELRGGRAAPTDRELVPG